MPNFFTRILLFFSSYAPLLFIVSLRSYEKIGWWCLLFGGTGLVSVVVLWLFLRKAWSLEPFTVRVECVSQRDSEAMAYIASYVIPFIDLPFDNWKASVSLAIFFLMLMIIYINSHMIHINPTLNAAGFHLMEIEVNGEVHSLITRKRHVPRGSDLRVHKLGESTFLEASK